MLPITASNALKYSLYHARAVHVPVNMGKTAYLDDTTNHDYTKISLPYSYLAVARSGTGYQFIELNPPDLEKCTLIGLNYYCPQNFLELGHLHTSCLTSLFLNATMEDIVDQCQIDYIFEPFKPKAELIDVGNYYLISGLNQPWRYQCTTDHIPRDISGA